MGELALGLKHQQAEEMELQIFPTEEGTWASVGAQTAQIWHDGYS